MANRFVKKKKKVIPELPTALYHALSSPVSFSVIHYVPSGSDSETDLV